MRVRGSRPVLLVCYAAATGLHFAADLIERQQGLTTGKVFFGSLVISGVRNYLIFQANKAYPDRSRWIRWNKCLTFRIP